MEPIADGYYWILETDKCNHPVVVDYKYGQFWFCAWDVPLKGEPYRVLQKIKPPNFVKEKKQNTA